MKVSHVSLIVIALIYSGCSFSNIWKGNQTPTPQNQVIIEKVDKEDIRQALKEEKLYTLGSSMQAERVFGATGEGIAPLNTISPAQALALAKRAALADAYRQLGAKLFGVKISAKDTVQDAALKDSRIEAQVNALVKNATITDTTFKDGLYRVTMELKMNENRWKEIFAY